ncbi:MAG: 4Fe-4S dicluster domain-containing protein [Calditrichaeota bacterium]|nr:4Fe-4S dicluster domain-containing protein [Calditrichota bacterium]
MSEQHTDSRGQWLSIEEYHAASTGRRTPEFSPAAEEPMSAEQLPAGLSRRRFMTLLGASAALAATGCSRQIDRGKIVAYTQRPEEVTPGVANYYASACGEGSQVYSVLVKTREGRPIHIEGNDEHPDFAGRTSLRTISEILNLYDPDRLRTPRLDGKDVDPAAAASALQAAMGGKVLLLTGAGDSPTRQALVKALAERVPGLEHRTWEALDNSTNVPGSMELYGQSARIVYEIDKADALLTLDADILGTAGNATVQSRQRALNRRVNQRTDTMSRHWAVDSAMTLTGSKADHRLGLRANAMGGLALALVSGLRSHGRSLPAGVDGSALSGHSLEEFASAHHLDPALLDALLRDLNEAGRKSLVIAGQSLSAECHAAVALLNAMLDNRGTTWMLQAADPALPMDAAGMKATIAEMSAGSWNTVILCGVNPLYDTPASWGFAAGLQAVKNRVFIGLREDESAAACQLVLPMSHWLEGWGDWRSRAGLYCLQQPVIAPLWDTMQWEEHLLQAAGLAPDYHAFLMDHWRQAFLPAGTLVDFNAFWNAVLHDGIHRRSEASDLGNALRAPAVSEALAALAGEGKAAHGEGLELVLLPGHTLYDGRTANIGWLQECPDPVTKETWGNSLQLSWTDAEAMGMETGALVRVSVGGVEHDFPLIVTPGQTPGVAVLTHGGGRSAGSVASGVGVNTFAYTDFAGQQVTVTQIEASKGQYGEKRSLVTQRHFNLEGRDHVRHWTMEQFANHSEPHVHKDPYIGRTFYPIREYPNHKWGMVVDLSACTGCTACVMACQSENNIPVVGPERVAKGREMHWIRIDRYYEGNPAAPTVLHQPMMCQHCDNAPCENVCPVAATSHSEEGLNTMTYNRCVGTRYCGNNCPYKVRRFNFFAYTDKRSPLDLAANPEVTVRDRGIMEKCTFCIQRINNARNIAKSENRPVRDGEIRTACQNACPTDAIIFGDLKDPSSRLSRALKTDRGYKVLEELGVGSAVTYLAEVRNPALSTESGDAHEQH